MDPPDWTCTPNGLPSTRYCPNVCTPAGHGVPTSGLAFCLVKVVVGGVPDVATFEIYEIDESHTIQRNPLFWTSRITPTRVKLSLSRKLPPPSDVEKSVGSSGAENVTIPTCPTHTCDV